jgi:TatD DNase family protein
VEISKKAGSQMYFDSHTHINNEKYTPAQRLDLIRSIEQSDVDFVVDIGFDKESSKMATKHAMEYDWCFAAVGVHPHNAEEYTSDDINVFRRLASEPDVVAIGEIGLDFFRDLSPRGVQRKVFREMIRLALDIEMPISIHDRDSDGEVLRILEEEGAFSRERKCAFPANPETGRSDARVLLHCFSGDVEDAFQAIENGCTISIAGPVTYKNNKKTVGVATSIPMAHMLVETDAPYLAPEPFRGKQNSSPLIQYTVGRIAALRDSSPAEVAAVTKSNAMRFFGIK